MMACAPHGRIHEASTLFKQIPKPNLVTLNSMLTGYAQEEASIIHETGLAVTHDITIGDWLEVEKSPAANSLSVVGGHQAVATSYFATPPNSNGSSSGGFDSVAELVSTAFSLWVALAYLIAVFRPTSLNGRTLRWQVLGFTLTLLVGVILVTCYLGRTTSNIVTPLARGCCPFSTEDSSEHHDCQVSSYLHQSSRSQESSYQNVCSFNTVIAGHVKFGLLEDAQKLFNEMPKRDIVSWNTMIRALRTHRYCEGAF
ncbi:Pentatricopeptide repeat-containing protein, mitochondrial [Cinnamomum micranthum f. kanehirae]|uniref:Pentatricopeptide repeat-containing protein, mitochondrial n=1 Tax=Cinnamomum micranthum f. kanehirae TaxID=337451 RepID=A0A3S3QLA1_9MAGN|nr:Pentatricopeptide repeat-containing protein, mitochondrial [Cinnamomum micranthum f. kanehirae]